MSEKIETIIDADEIKKDGTGGIEKKAVIGIEAIAANFVRLNFSEGFEKNHNGNFVRTNMVNIDFSSIMENGDEYSNTARLDMTFSLNSRGGKHDVLLEKETFSQSYSARYYTPETVFLEPDKKLKIFLTYQFETFNYKNIFVLRAPQQAFASREIMYQADIDFNKVTKRFVTLSSNNAVAAKNIDDQINDNDFNQDENNAIGSILEKNGLLSALLPKLSTMIKKSMDHDFSDIAILDREKKSVEAAREMLGLFYKNESTSADLDKIAKMLQIETRELDLLQMAIQSNKPLSFILEKRGELESTFLISLAERYAKNSIAYIHAGLSNADEAKKMIASGAPLRGNPMFILASDELQQLHMDGFGTCTPIQSIEKFKNLPKLSKGEVIVSVETEEMFGSYGAPAIQMNSIIFVGDVPLVDKKIETVASRLTSSKSKALAKKWIGRINISTTAGKTAALRLALNVSSHGEMAFFVKSPFNKDVLYAFASAQNTQSTYLSSEAGLPDFDEWFQTIPSAENFEDFCLSGTMALKSVPSGNSMARYFNAATSSFGFSAHYKENTKNSFLKYITSIEDGSHIGKIRLEGIFREKIASLSSIVIEDEFSALDIKETAKVFPDIMNVGSRKKYSLADIAGNSIMTSRYLQMPGMSSTIKKLLDKFKYASPNVQPFMYNLVDQSKNSMHPQNKDVISSNSGSLGILNYKYIPPFISIKTEEEKDAFVDVVRSVISSELKETILNEKIESNLDKMRTLIGTGQTIALKAKVEYDPNSGIFKQNEFFSAMNSDFSDIGIMDIPPMKVYEEMQKAHGLSIKNRTASVIGKDSTITQIYHGIFDFVENFYTQNKNEWIDKASIDIIGASLKAGAELNIDQVYTAILKKGRLNSLAKKTIGERPQIPELIDKTIREAASFYESLELPFNPIAEKYKISQFINEHFFRKEKEFCLGKNAEKNKEFFNDFFHDTEYIEILWGNLSALASYDGMLETAVKRIFQVVYYREKINHYGATLGVNPRDLPTYIGGGGKDSEMTKVAAVHRFLIQCLGLTPHQATEAKGFVLMNLDGIKNTELLFWEMRTGKTRAMLAIQLLLSIIKKGDSIFFVQKKNFDDIIMQAWDMQPLIVSELGLFVGGQNRFNIRNFATSAPLSTSVFPNIPYLLKKFLVNPIDGSDVPPAKQLSQTYLRDFQLIKDNIKKQSDPFSTLQGNKAFSDFSFLIDEKICRAGGEIAISMISTFYYVKMLENNGFIALDEKLKKKIKKTLTDGFFGRLKNDEDELANKKNGRIIFAGKQYIDRFAAYSTDEKQLGANNSKNQILSAIDVDADIEKMMTPSHEKVEGSILAFVDEIDSHPEIRSVSFQNKILLPSLSPNHFLMKSNSSVTQSSNKNVKRFVDIDLEAVFSGMRSDNETAINNPLGMIEGYEDQCFEDIVKFTKGMVQAVLDAIPFVPNESCDSRAYLDFSDISGEPKQGSLIDMINLFKVQDTSTMDPYKTYVNYVFDQFQRLDFIDPMASTKYFVDKALPLSRMAEIVSSAFYKNAVRIFLSGHEIPSVKGRVGAIFGRDQVTNAMDAKFTVFLSGNHIKGVTPSGTQRVGDNVAYFISDFSLTTTASDEEDPSEFYNTVAQPREIVYEILGQGKNNTIIKKASFFDANSKERKIKRGGDRISESLNSDSFWEGDSRDEVVAVAIDEGHKNTSSNKGFQAKSLLESIENRYGDAAKIIATGTPLAGIDNFARLMETMSGIKDAKFTKSIIKHCGNFKFKNEFMSLLFFLLSTDNEVAEVVVNHLSKLNDNGTLAEDAAMGTAETDAMFEDVWASKGIQDAISGLRDDIGHVYIDYRESKFAFNELMQTVLKRGSKGKQKTIDIDTLWEVARRETTLAPGFSNPVAFAGSFDFIKKANTAIKRPSDDMEYNIIDKDFVYEAMSGSVTDMGISNKGVNLLLAELAIDKYKRALFLPQVKSSILAACRCCIQAIRDNPAGFGFMNTSEALDVLNRSQVSIADGIDDYVDYVISKGRLPIDISDKKTDVLKYVMEQGMGILYNHKDNVSAIAQAKHDEQETVLIKTLDQKFSIPLDENALQVRGHFEDGGMHRAFSFNDKKDEVGSIFMEDYRLFAKNDSKKPPIKISYEFNFEYIVDNFVPPVQFTINAISMDDRSIFETAAFLDQTKKLSVDSLNRGENQRIMTTRVAITQFAIATAISAAMEREDKSAVVTLIVNSTDKRVEQYLSDISGIQSALAENNIKIVKTNSNTINSAFELALDKREQLVVIGNYESLAEGFNMEFVDTGIYLGAIDKTAAATQSFARQIGHTKKKSSFYLANGGGMYSYKGGGDIDANSVASLSLGIWFDDKGAKEMQTQLLALFSNDITKRPSYNARINGKQMLELRSHEHFMNGALADSETHDAATVESWSASREIIPEEMAEEAEKANDDAYEELRLALPRNY